jgi:hypothetical protein
MKNRTRVRGAQRGRSGQDALPSVAAPDVTALLRAWTDGDAGAFDELVHSDRLEVTTVDVRTGETLPHAEVMRDRLAVPQGPNLRISRDGRTIVYSDSRLLRTCFWSRESDSADRTAPSSRRSSAVDMNRPDRMRAWQSHTQADPAPVAPSVDSHRRATPIAKTLPIGCRSLSPSASFRCGA